MVGLRTLVALTILSVFALACDESSSAVPAGAPGADAGATGSSGGTTPAGVIVEGPQQGLYVIDDRGSLHHVSLEDGTVHATYLTEGTDRLQLRAPRGIAATKRHIYITDAGNRRLVQLTAGSGAGWKELALGADAEPHGVGAFLSEDESEEKVLFADFTSGQFFSAPKDLAGEPAPLGKLTSGFNACSVAVKKDGAAATTGCTSGPALNLVVSPYNVERIYPLSAGTGELSRPDAVAYMPDGTLVLADTGNHRVLCRLGKSGEFGKRGTTTPLEFEAIVALAVDLRGRIFIGDSVNERIVRVDDCTGANAKVIYEGTTIPRIAGMAAVGPYEGAQGQ